MVQESENNARNYRSPWFRAVLVLLGVALVIVAVVVAKNAIQGQVAPHGASDGAAGASSEGITSVRGDFSARYEAALGSGKPVFVYFHTTTCPSCKEFSPVVEKVMPAYEGTIVFVNALEEDKEAYDLATQYKFGYVPTSLFLKADGTAGEPVVGPMTESELRRQLNIIADAK